ncbi:MAG: NTP transferase domain-containing protein [Gemmatimonadaceae bacterium]
MVASGNSGEGLIRRDASPRIGAVVLAAGGSTRLGFPKQLILYKGEPLVRRTAKAAVEAGAKPVVVVLGARADTIRGALTGLDPVTAIVNRDWRNGIASSVVAGLSAVFADPDCDAVLITLADQPLIDAAALKRLIAAFDNRHLIVASGYGHTIGVPAIFARDYKEDLLQLTGDTGAGAWLRSKAKEVTRVPLAAAAAHDIDTQTDAANLIHEKPL